MTITVCNQDVTTTHSRRSAIRLLAIMEATTVTGPAKNLFDFCRLARASEFGGMVDTSILTFQRVQSGSAAPPVSNDFIDQALREGIDVHRISERFTFDWRVVRELSKVVRRLDPDIIQTHGMKSHFLVRLCGLHKHRAWVAFHHGYTKSTFTRSLLAQLDRWSLQAPNQVVTVSQSFSRQLSSRGIPSSRVVVLPNAIDADWLCGNSTGGAALSSDEKLVLAVGRLSKEKGFLYLVAAIAHLKQTHPTLAVRLMILGEGLERKNIEDAIHRAGLEQHVCLAGHVKDVRPYYRSASLLAIPSLSEGSPNALLEAMAAGVPVVSTAVGGIPEILSHHETALLVPPRDHVALSNAIYQLLADRGLSDKMANRAQELIRKRYSPLSRTQSLLSLYERLNPRANLGQAEPANSQLNAR